MRPGPSERVVVAGWARKKHLVPPGLILDAGSGAFPNPAADILVDGEPVDSRHRHGLAAVIDRPFVVARVEHLPFRDDAFAFVIASHIAEHVDDPAGFCTELARVADAGYIETPSPMADWALHEEYHMWRVGQRRDTLRFTAKGSRSRATVAFTEPLYRLFYAGRTTCSRPPYRVPSGPAGKAITFCLQALGWGLGRLGLMDTSYSFTKHRPLRWEISSSHRP